MIRKRQSSLWQTTNGNIAKQDQKMQQATQGWTETSVVTANNATLTYILQQNWSMYLEKGKGETKCP